MKLALVGINAKFIHSNLAIYDLAAYAHADFGEHISICEYTINQPQSQILRNLYLEQADAYFFSCYLWNIDLIKSVTLSLSKVLPHAAIWLGGPEVSYNAEAVLGVCPWVSGIMRGEGEESFYELCRAYISGDSVNAIAGISYSYDGKIISNPDRAPFDLSSLPFCYEVLDGLKLENRIIYYESSRGCPFNCSYCLSSVDKSVRYRSLEQVFHELDYFLEKRVPQVKFVDRTFNCNHARTMAIWQYMIEHDNGYTNFHCEIAAELLNEEELALINTMRPGLIQLEIGVQTTNTETLKEIHRPSDYERLRAIVERIHSSRNIHCHLDLIAGLPHEDIKSFRKSYNEVYALEPDQLQLGFLKLLKGSYMDIHHGEYDCVATEDAPFEVLSTRWLSYDDVLTLKKVEEMTEVYYNSMQFTNTIPYLLSYFESPYDLFLALGEFYDEHGYFDIAHSRVRRYEILLEFADGTEIDREMLIEYLTLDLYLRENLKKRPDWMKDISAEKTRIRELSIAHDIPIDHMHHIEAFERIYEDRRYIMFDYHNKDRLTGNFAQTTLI